MRTLSWLRSLAGRLLAGATASGIRPVRPDVRPAAARVRGQAALRLELLEDRCLLAAGALDPSFNAGAFAGRQSIAFLGTNTSVVANAVAVQPDGKLVVAGTFTFSNGGTDFAVARFDARGVLDPSFGFGGRTTIDIGNGSNDQAFALTLQGDGRIVVVGSTVVGAGDANFAVARLHTDGSLDTSFSGDGIQTIAFDLGPAAIPPTPAARDDQATAVGFQIDGKVVVAGFAQVNAQGNYDFAVARLNTNGSLDVSFDTDGRQTVAFDLGTAPSGTNNDRAQDLAIQEDGKIVLAGFANVGNAANTFNFAVARLNANGSLDTSFDTDGRQAFAFNSLNQDFATGAALQPDSKIVVVGTTTVTIGGETDFAVARLNANGSFDTSFDTDGRQTVAFNLGGTNNDEGNDVAIQADGSILLAGSAATATAGDSDFAVARLTTAGTLDTAFDTDGRQTIAFQVGGNNADVATGIALQRNGRIVVAGFNGAPGATTRIAVARLLGPAATSTVGAFDPATGNWTFRNSNTAGNPDIGPFAYGPPGWLPIVGDWDGDGDFTVGVFDPATATFYLRNSNSAGAPDIAAFAFGTPGWLPVAGDWDGDGVWTIGVFDPATAIWFLRNSNTQGIPDGGTFPYGGPGWKPAVGDWDGNGTTTIGVIDPSGNWYLRNNNTAGPPDVAPFAYGAGSWTPIGGDWDGDGDSTVGVFDPAGNWYLRNTNTPGTPDVGPFQFGQGTFLPVAGDWNFPAAPLRAAFDRGPGAAAISTGQLQSVVSAALGRLRTAGVSSRLLDGLAGVTVELRDLPGATLSLAYTAGNRVVIDDDGAGRGWFVDPTPGADEEFAASGQALAGSAAAGRTDLLTAMLHEYGHLAGLSDDIGSTLMAGMLDLGTRYTQALDTVFGQR